LCFKLFRKNYSQPEDSMRTPETIKTLNKLIQTCRDAEIMCGTWSAAADSTHLQWRLRHRAEEWGRQGDELQALVLLLGGEPETAATSLTRLRAGWVMSRALVLGGSDSPALDGCELAHQRALGHYEAALAGYLPERIRTTVGLQARQISARCDRVIEPRGRIAA
jgi:uncharacterized protein (TIGR02284 family)